MPRGVKSKKTAEDEGNHEDRFLKAFDEYADALFRHAVIRLSDRERAIELVHDSFTKAWGYVRAGNEIDAYRPFLYKILSNLIIDEYRKRKTESLDAMLEEEGIDEGYFDDLIEDSFDRMIESLDAKQVALEIHRLPEMYKEVLTFRFVDGLGPKEISELIEESENVVSVRLNRGVAMLRIHIEEKSGDEKNGQE